MAMGSRRDGFVANEVGDILRAVRCDSRGGREQHRASALGRGSDEHLGAHEVDQSRANSLTAFADKNKLCAQSREAALNTSVRVLCFLMIALTLKKGEYFKAKSQFSPPVTFLISPTSMVVVSPL